MKRLFAAAALAPLCFAASAAYGQTEINTAQTEGLVTSTTGNLTTTAAGTITLTDGGDAITVNSDNNVNQAGAITIRDAGGTGILVTTPAGGRTSTIVMTGTMQIDDTKTGIDTDGDGDLDGDFVTDDAERFGLRVVGDGPLIGNITRNAGSTSVKGNGGAGISIETALIGNLVNLGSIDVIGGTPGLVTYGIHLAGPVTGNVTHTGAISATGLGAVGLAVDDIITGRLLIDGAITATGYRYGNIANPILDEDDLLIGGPAVQVRGSVGGGILIDNVAAQDTDNDGTVDVPARTGALQVFSTQPALSVGGAGNIVLGNVGTAAADQYGLSIKGTVGASGVHSSFAATGVKLGGEGGNVDVSGGVSIAGSVTATGTNADATGLHMAAGAGVGAGSTTTVLIDGSVSASADTDVTATPTARALQIDAGARVTNLIVNGALSAAVNGPAGDATALLDSSGTLASIVNTGSISAGINTDNFEVLGTGQTIALDLRANTTGVTVRQAAHATLTADPSISGDILFGSGADSLIIEKGQTFGQLSFGDGDDALTIQGNSTVAAALVKGAGGLAVNVADGRLNMLQTSAIQMSSLNIGADGVIAFNADPAAADPAQRVNRVDVTGTAVLQSGSQVSLAFRSKVTDADPVTLTLVQAATLNNQGVDDSLLGDLPFLYSATLTSSATQLNAVVQRRTAAQLGLTGGRAQAFEAFYDSFDADPNVAAAVFGKTNAADFNALYDQFLPDYSGGPFRGMAAGVRTVLQAAAEEPVDMTPGGTRSWLQEVGVGVEGESVSDIEYSSRGFGLAGGVERSLVGGGVIGVSIAYFNNEIKNDNRAFGSLFSVSSVMGGVYWRDSIGGLRLNASVNGGAAFFDSDRRVVDQTAAGVQNLIRQAEASWTGYMAAARFGAAYEVDMGAFYLRPEALIDYIYLQEQAYTETGGGVAVNLKVDSRTSSEAAAEAGLVIGARFGRTFRWGPEFRVAYRTVFGDGIDDTTARFTLSPATSFTLPALLAERNRMVVRAAIRGSGAYANFAVEAGGDFADSYDAYIGRLIVRFMF